MKIFYGGKGLFTSGYEHSRITHFQLLSKDKHKNDHIYFVSIRQTPQSVNTPQGQSTVDWDFKVQCVCVCVCVCVCSCVCVCVCVCAEWFPAAADKQTVCCGSVSCGSSGNPLSFFFSKQQGAKVQTADASTLTLTSMLLRWWRQVSSLKGKICHPRYW